MRPIRLSAVLAFAMLCGAQKTAPASPLELYGFGARSSAMAGSGVSTCPDFDCVYLNPARLAWIRTKSVSGGYSYGDFSLRINGKLSAAENTKATTFGLVVPLQLGGPLAGRMSLGLGILVPRAAVARARSPEVGAPGFALLDSRSEVVGIQVALGYAFSERFSGGFGVLVSGTLTGDILLDVDGAGRFITRSEQKLKSDLAPVLAFAFESRTKIGTSARYRIGANVRGSSQAGYDIEIDNKLGAKLPLSLPKLLVVGTPQYDPASLAVEFGLQVSPQLGMQLQLDYKRWSAFPLPTENPIEFGEPLPNADFHDTVVPRVALEWKASLGSLELALRSGYSFVYSPAPEMSGLLTLLDNHRHVGSVGIGFSWPDTKHGLRVQMWMQEHLLIRRHHQKEDPAAELSTIGSEGAIRIGGMTLGVDL